MKVTFALTMLATLALTTTHSLSPILSLAQTQERKILKEVKWGPAPVEVTDIQINNGPVSLDHAFEPNEEAWIRDLRFKVTNHAKSDISYLRFELQFPVKDRPRPGFYVQAIEYGSPSSSGKSGGTKIKPGESIQLKGTVDFNALRSFVRQNAEGDYVKLNTALLSTEVVDFSDKTSWLVGSWSRFDEKTKKWIGKTEPLQQLMSVSSDIVLQPAGFQPTRPADCFKAIKDSYDCQAECQCGIKHDVTIPGPDIVSAGVSEADKWVTCCTGCLIAYTGTALCH
jgi:hypothetical protein